MDALEAILGRRSIRKYTAEPVTEADIDTILHAAMAAPSAGNQQPWHFVVSTDREQLARMAECTPYGSMLLAAPLAIAVCADTRELKHPQMWQQDCGAATENALVAIHALGLRVDRIGCAIKNSPAGLQPDLMPARHDEWLAGCYCDRSGIAQLIVDRNTVWFLKAEDRLKTLDRFHAVRLNRDRVAPVL